MPAGGAPSSIDGGIQEGASSVASFPFRAGRVLVGGCSYGDQFAIVPEHFPGAREALWNHQ